MYDPCTRLWAVHMSCLNFEGAPYLSVDIHSSNTNACDGLPAQRSQNRNIHAFIWHYASIEMSRTLKQLMLHLETKVQRLLCMLKKDDSFHFTAQVPLPSIFHLPLAAEPPLYINVVHSDIQGLSMSGFPHVTRAWRATWLALLEHARHNTKMHLSQCSKGLSLCCLVQVCSFGEGNHVWGKHLLHHAHDI